MSPPKQPSSGTYRIVSLTEGNAPAGIDPTLLPAQIVRLNARDKDWTLQLINPLTYRFRVGGYPFTGIADDSDVIANLDANDTIWHVTLRTDQEAYTIELADDQSKGWTVVPDGSANPPVKIKSIVPTASDPPQFSPTQLWKIQ